MKVRIVIIIVPLLIFVLALATGSILLLRLFYTSLFVLLLSFLWAFFGLHGLEIRYSKSSERSQVGEWFDEEITIFNKSRLPKSMITVQENSDGPGHHNTSSFNLPPRSSHLWQTRVYCRHRGQFNLGTFTATVTDPLGFFTLGRSFGEPQSIIVYPATLELPSFQPESRLTLDKGPSRWFLSETSPNAARVREYANGDTLNRIHWHSTAHTGKLMVKVFDPDRLRYTSKNVWLILNMHQAAQLELEGEATEEYCITIAASLMKKYIDSGKPVGLIASGDQPYFFPPGTGDEYLLQVLETLALMEANGEVPVDQLISQEIEHFEANSTIIIITPSTDDQIVETIRYLGNRGNLVIVILLDSSSFGGTVNTAGIAKGLMSSGAQVYSVRRGQDIVRALNSRVQSSSLVYVRDT
jgi:uncharacterized protein (DUF58 family)